jgi:DNA ligase-associated metallophosphoesterase
MIKGAAETIVAGETVFLLPQKVLWWPAAKTLIVADVHWGKAGHFRRHGMAIPARATARSEERLTEVVALTHPEKVIFAGDLFHSEHNAEVAAFADWAARYPHIELHLVLGNHDILGTDFYEKCRLQIHLESLFMPPFIIAHDALSTAGGLVIHGHIHPGIKLHGAARQTIAVPCFALDKKRLILPAFGAFTGCFWLQKPAFLELYAVGDEEVIRVK